MRFEFISQIERLRILLERIIELDTQHQLLIDRSSSDQTLSIPYIQSIVTCPSLEQFSIQMQAYDDDQEFSNSEESMSSSKNFLH